MPNLKEFVEALKAGWLPALAAAIGCGLILLGDWYQLPYLSSAPPFVTTTAAYIGVFALSVLLANSVRLPIHLYKWIERYLRRRKTKKKIITTVEELPEPELWILAYLISSKRKAFGANLLDKRLVPLIARGLIIRKNGQYNVLNWPHVVQNDVWNYLIENKEYYFVPDAELLPDPFADRLSM